MDFILDQVESVFQYMQQEVIIDSILGSQVRQLYSFQFISPLTE